MSEDFKPAKPEETTPASGDIVIYRPLQPAQPPLSPLLGMYITYLLHPDENPTFPHQKWHGRIKQLFWTYSNMSQMPLHVRGFLIDILDEDWIGYEDMIRPSQILEISALPLENPRLQP